MSAGGDPNLCSASRTTPLSCCFEAPSSIAAKCAVCLLTAGANVDAEHYLIWAIKRGLTTVVESLIGAGASARVMVGPHESALHYTLRNYADDVSLFKCLLAGGADPNENNNEYSILWQSVLVQAQAVRN